MASSSEVRSGTTSRISLHKINVNIHLLQIYERRWIAPSVALLYSLCTQTRPRKLQHQRCLYDICWDCVIDLLVECAHMCLEPWYYVGYNELQNARKQPIYIRSLKIKTFEKLLNMHEIGTLRCNKLLAGWQFEYMHVQKNKDPWSPNKGLLELLEPNSNVKWC